MIFDWSKNGPTNQQNSKNKLCGGVRHQSPPAEPRPRRGEGGSKPLPRLGGLGGSDWKGEEDRRKRRGIYTQTRWVGGLVSYISDVAITFVMSRLFYNVHVWSTFAGKARDILNAVYMRTWRRAVGDLRHGRTTWTNAQVLHMVGMPKIETFVRRRRLNYFLRLANVKFDALHTLLQQRDKYGKQLPWVQLIVGDLRALKHFFADKLNELPCPSVSIEPYWRLATDYPHEWKCLVKQLGDVSIEVIPADVHSGGAHADGLSTYTCEQCSAAFCTYKKLAVHKWSKHRERSQLRHFIADVSRCPVCNTDFRKRPRLIKHLMENRARSTTRSESCKSAFLATSPAKIADHIFMSLEACDAVNAKADRHLGHTSVIAKTPCCKGAPSVLRGWRLKRAVSLALEPRCRLMSKTR